MTDSNEKSSDEQIEKTTKTTSEQIQPKSPLEFTWTFWYIKPEKRGDWEKSLVKLIDVAFVEDFWATYNHLALPSKLSAAKINSDYYFFRKGIRPMWEDPANEHGGRWVLGCGNDDQKLDNLWQETLLGMIGDCFSHDSDNQPLSRFITGCVVSIRIRGHKIALWTSEGKNATIVKEIGRRWKTMMNLPPNNRIQFELHHDANGGGGQGKHLYEE